MVYTRFIQAGRVALVMRGEFKNQLVTIVDILDQKQVLVECPFNGIKRHVMSVNSLQLTNLLVEIARGASSDELKKALEDANILAEWQKTYQYKRIVSENKKKNLNDFDRYKVSVLLAKKRELVKAAMTSA